MLTNEEHGICILKKSLQEPPPTPIATSPVFSHSLLLRGYQSEPLRLFSE